MTTTRKTKDNGAEAAKQEQPKRTNTKASDYFEPVSKVILDAGPEGLTLAELSDLTGIRSRVLHNVAWHLEKNEKIRRVGEGRPIHYASTEVKAPRKRAPRKATAKKATAA
jgi:hypothetical protein